MYTREKSYIVKKFILDSYIIWLYLAHVYKECLKNYHELNLKYKLVITSRTSSALTLVKSPMAQKTWSKEQVGYKYFNIKLYLFFKNFDFFYNLIKNDTWFLYFFTKYLIKLVFYTNTPIMMLKYSIINININYKNKLYF